MDTGGTAERRPPVAGPRFWRLLPAVAGIVTGVFLCSLEVPEFAPAVRAGQAEGRPGAFVLEAERCPRDGCHWVGTFLPDDGGPHTHEVRFYGDLPADPRPGDRVAAVDTGSARWVFTATGTWARAAKSAFTLLVGTTVLLLGVLALTPRGRRFFARLG